MMRKPLDPGGGGVNEWYTGIPVSERTISHAWSLRVEEQPHDIFLKNSAGRSLTYVETHLVVGDYLNHFVQLGLSPGSRVVVFARNSFEMVALFLACLLGGYIFVPINTRLIGHLLNYIIADADPDLVIADSDGEKILKELEASSTAQILAIDSLTYDFDQQRTDTDSRTPEPHDHAAILYTSGTTGPPKGAMVSHEYYFYYAWVFAYQMGYRRGDVLFTCLPLFHGNAQCATVLAAVLSGAAVALEERFSASRFWEQIALTDATQFTAMGTMANILMKGTDVPEPHHLVHCQVVPPPEDLEAFEKRFGVQVVYGNYGLTEAMVYLPSWSSERKGLGWAGNKAPFFDVILVDDNDRPVPKGHLGEIAIRPRLPHIMFSGYWNKPLETTQAFRNCWFHTGDIGRVDDNGHFWFCGRNTDSIRRRGENISAWEIESTLEGSSSILEAAAIGVPSELGEEDVCVFVIPADSSMAPNDIEIICESLLPDYMRPRYVELVEALPKNASFRVLKHELKQLFIDRHGMHGNLLRDDGLGESAGRPFGNVH